MHFSDIFPIIQDTLAVLPTPMGAAQSTESFEQLTPESPYVDGDVVNKFFSSTKSEDQE